MKVCTAGPDNIPGCMLRTGANQLADVIFNISQSQEGVPTCFKTATIVPVPKQHTVSSLNRYRPVPLTPILMKCFEKLFPQAVRLFNSSSALRHKKKKIFLCSIKRLQLAFHCFWSNLDTHTHTHTHTHTDRESHITAGWSDQLHQTVILSQDSWFPESCFFFRLPLCISCPGCLLCLCCWAWLQPPQLLSSVSIRTKPSQLRSFTWYAAFHIYSIFYIYFMYFIMYSCGSEQIVCFFVLESYMDIL